MVGRGQAEAGASSARADRDRRPVAVVLEGVGGDVDALPVGIERFPVDRDARDVQAGERGDERDLLVAVLALGGDRRRPARTARRRGRSPGTSCRPTRARRRGSGRCRGRGAPSTRGSSRRRPSGSRGLWKVMPSMAFAEVVEHRVHQRRVERVADGRAACSCGLRTGRRSARTSSLDACDDQGVRSVDRGDGDAGGQVRGHFVLGGLERDHHAAGRKCLHEDARAETSVQASSRLNTPAMCAAPISPIEWPVTCAAVTPSDSSSR